jgi:glycosyltransferase involved in cell wall biosynthesis
MSCYNAEKTVAWAIESILDQGFTAYEFIIIDDGSKDGTSDIIRSYERKEPCIKAVYNRENQGLSACLNQGIKMAQTDYIVRMDADDIALSDRLRLQYEFMEAHPEVDICGGAIIPVFENGIKGASLKLPAEHEQIVKRVFKKTMVFHPTIIIKKEVYDKYGYYDETLRWAEDADLWYRIYDRVRWHNLQEPLLFYRTKSRLSKKIITNNIKVKWRGLLRRKLLWRKWPILLSDISLYAFRVVMGR